MNIDEIKTFLPHRNAMLLVDNAEFDGVSKGVGSYTVKGTEFFLDGHFPGNPIVPGVILCEIAAQICSVALADLFREKKVTPFFTTLDEVKIRNFVVPGDTYSVAFELKRQKHPFYFFTVSGSVGDKRVLSAKFSFAIKG